MHPERDDAHVRLRPHPVTAGLSDFTVFDERYSFLRVSRHSDVLATHELDGVEHPLVGVREADGRLGRAAYDALGHDAASFDSAEHAALIGRLIGWLGR